MKLLPNFTSFLVASFVAAGAGMVATTSHGGESSSLKFGPGSMGRGGTNPIDLPPLNPLQIEYTSVSKTGYEYNIGLSPGITFGHRFSKESYYFSMGGGFLFHWDGLTLGVYNAFGYVTGDGKPGEWHFNYEFKHALGPDPSGGLVAPSALRIGIIWD